MPLQAFVSVSPLPKSCHVIRQLQSKPLSMVVHPAPHPARVPFPDSRKEKKKSISLQANELKVSESQNQTVIHIYDTTLRDGTQGEGISLSVIDKIKIAHRLDEFGVHYIEGGWPGSNPKDEEFFANCKNLHNARLVAFGSTRYKNVPCDDDANVQALLKSETPVVCLVGKTWDMQVQVVLEASLEENLAMISDTVKYFKARDREVMLDAEHFFDGYKASPEYALKCLAAAADVGVDVLVLCDTNGGTLPWEIGEITNAVVSTFPHVRVGIHCHNDMELAVANSISAVTAGATLVQGTINGYGERTGNANLISIVPALQLKMGYATVGENLNQLTGVSRYVDEIANQTHDASRPFVGASSFAHKGGLHVAAIMKNADTYQHIDPALVGNEGRVLVSELAGRRNIIIKAKEIGLISDSDDHQEWNNIAKLVLKRVKDLESVGYSFEGAEASLELMLRREVDGYRPPFELIDFQVLTDNKRKLYDEETTSSPKNVSNTQATIKIALLGPTGGGETCPTKICLEVAEGNGPVDAVNAALEKALFQVYRELRTVSLTDYKVRLLDNERATGATTRVLVDFRDSATGREWTTVYAHPNIIVASVNALVDGFEVAMWDTLPQCML